MKRDFEGRVSGINAPVGEASVPGQRTGIGFSVSEGRVLISVTLSGKGLAVVLSGDEIDAAAGHMATAMEQALRHEHPSLGSMQ